MALFVGGPYDGQDLQFNTEIAETIRLPEADEWDNSDDHGATMPRHCPHVYQLDKSSDPPCYRYVES